MEKVPGLALVAVIGVLATVLNNLYPPVSAVLISLLLGFFVKCAAGDRKEFQPGAQYALKSLLKLAIIFLGVRLSFLDFAALGPRTLVIILACIVVSLVFTYWIAQKMKVPPRLGTLIAVCTAICGNSAVVATASVINAEDEEVAFAVGTITLFGMLAMIFYPLVGTLSGLPDFFFGTWAGTAINDTSQVVTAGFMYSERAGEIATVVKLTRNLFIAPVVFLASLIHCAGKAREGSAKFSGIFPWFVLGFVALALLRTWGLVPAPLVGLLKEASSFLILMAIAGIGLSFNIQAIKNLGLKSLYIGLFASAVMGLVSFSLIYWLL